MVRKRPPTRGRQSSRSSSAVVTHAQLKRENHLVENGMKIRPGPHPTDFISIPWYNLVVRVQDFTTITFGIDATGNPSVYESIRTQLQLSLNDVLEYRIQTVRIWGPIVAMNAATPLQPLRARFWSLVPQVATAAGSSSFLVLEEISSYPDQVSRASLGFVYPKSQQAIPIQQNNSGTLVSLTLGGGTGNVAYINVCWRPRQALNVNAGCSSAGNDVNRTSSGGWFSSS